MQHDDTVGSIAPTGAAVEGGWGGAEYTAFASMNGGGGGGGGAVSGSRRDAWAEPSSGSLSSSSAIVYYRDDDAPMLGGGARTGVVVPASPPIYGGERGVGEGAPPRKRMRYTRGALVDSNRMHPQRFKRGYWDALYELWRLSWFEWGESAPASVPRPVSLRDWLAAIDSTDRAMARAYDIDPEDRGVVPDPLFPPAAGGGQGEGGGGGEGGGAAADGPFSGGMITGDFLTTAVDSQLTNQMRLSWSCQLNADWRPLRLSPHELVHVAGGLQRSELLTNRLRRGGDPPDEARPTLVYAIDPRVAVQLQHFLANWVVDQDLRPGPPGCADQYRALTMGAYKKYVYSGRFAPMMAIRHQVVAADAVERSIAAAEPDAGSPARE